MSGLHLFAHQTFGFELSQSDRFFFKIVVDVFIMLCNKHSDDTHGFKNAH